MEEQRRDVLERVARGELSPAEGAALLDELESSRGSALTAEAPHDRATMIRVARAFGLAEVIGDPSVREAVAEGPHVARREGDTLVIEGEDDSLGMPGFAFSWRGRHRPWRGHRRWGFHDMEPLRVRVNPDLPLEVETQAGSVRIRGVRAPIRAEVQAGRTDIEGFESPIDLTVQAGSVRARGRLDHGTSRIHCEAGNVRLHLEKGSSVRVDALTSWGRIRFNDDQPNGPWVIGAGAGTLDINSSMGSVRVTSDQ
jgi:hypothetical protein